MTSEFTDAELKAGQLLFERPWRFVMGVPSLDFLPPAGPVEIAFAGRSNVGKSSLINALVRQNGLARTSNTPGRTQELNFFVTDNVPLQIVDMPGYGFAKAPKEKVDQWTDLVFAYLQGRATLARVYLLIDARHGIKAVDEKILEMLDTAAVSYQIVLTKLDKISEAARPKMIAATQAVLAKHPAAFPAILGTSSEKGIGIAELRATIAALLAERTSL
ncbi:MAG: YihA family ribosome biogenesis GTP-binding protein [Hyphomicrobiaceae bacterium]|nr:YihA family ribosome biogenesis GTP-binding protein [Hyphomicrobiaceae bacterium]MCC0007759.1 YihA family ribosome biogenesis GTP-binding protein [Hyphomicrobiaceae bacterium]